MEASFVDKSVYTWPSNGHAHNISRTPSAYNAILWNKEPDLVTEANVMTPRPITMATSLPGCLTAFSLETVKEAYM